MQPVPKKSALALAAIAALGGFSNVKADTVISSFTPGDLVVLRGGDPTNPTTGGTVTVGAYLDEYTPAGVYQGTIDIPQATTGSNNPLTLTKVASSTHEGILTLSDNGNWLTFGGYVTAPTTASSGAGVSAGTLGEISQSASSLNTSTLISAPTTVRAAATVDGNEFYVSNNPGLEYISGTGATATNTLLSGSYNTRALATVNNTLVTGSGSSSLGTHGVWQLGASGALPTTATPSKTLLTDSTNQDGTDFIFANEPGDTLTSTLYQGRYNILYSVGGASTAQTINKYEYNGGTFTLLNSETPVVGGSDVLVGVTDIVSGNNVDVYYSDNSGVYEITDSNNAGSPLPNNGALLTGAPAGEFDFGVALAPTAVPEPATVGLIVVTAAGGLLSRRRTRA